MITANVSDVLGKVYDFVIVGGGTAGLVLAARLSENPSFTVAVLEAGNNTINDPMTSVPAPYGRQLGNPNRRLENHSTIGVLRLRSKSIRTTGKFRGLVAKVLVIALTLVAVSVPHNIWSTGGTSSINFLEWSLPPAIDVDAFERLGNHGWNWNEFYHYSRKIERFHPPTKEVADLYPHTYGADRGSSGPLRTTIAPHAHTADAIVRETFLNMGLTALYDPYNGEVKLSIGGFSRSEIRLTTNQVNGTWFPSSTIDPETWTRSNSATSYLVPAQDRPNLAVLTQALVCRVLFAEDNNGGDLVATGVEFMHQDAKYILSARKEVILSAGTIKNPQILELSGIGRSDILSRIGVETRLELPGVGENLQDHTFVPVSYELDPSAKHQTFDSLRKPEIARAAAELYAEGKGPLRNALSSFTYFPLDYIKAFDTSNVAAKIEKDINIFKNAPGIDAGLREQMDIQLDSLHSKASPEIEFATIPMLFSTRGLTGPLLVNPEGDKTYYTFLAFLVHPLSRGTIHSRTDNPRDDPDIDPHYFERDSDMEILIQGIKYIRTMAQTEPMKSAYVGEELQPGSLYTSDEELRDSLGTCSMLPRDKQGVVDPELKVYGTKNLRIVDISIIPLQIAAHTQGRQFYCFSSLSDNITAIAYVVGEKASDIILLTHHSARSGYPP
ncbi:hypothetical protein C0995_001033 [Termitomyces sp. Mi166|nr:hypothetical protein C0995_001033 [Termitomyces sp. Mi166\